ncbi:MAG TPA: M15 family metallopeptidase [Clostridiaceae bacterium]
MKIKALILFVLLINFPLSIAAIEIPKDSYTKTAKEDILSLMMAYPEYILDVKAKDNNLYLVMKSGKEILYDDKKVKNFGEKLGNGDLQDMLEEPYPLVPIDKLMEDNRDPGRVRIYPLLKEVYGNSKNSIEKNLSNINLTWRNCTFNNKNNAGNSLEAAMKELKEISRSKPSIVSVLLPISGTFNYRVIARTGQLSPHAFGIAIDLRSNSKDYWQWASKKDGEARLKSYPKEVVKAFENNNFIWGGKWSHFDILHFEYRPEIIIKARLFSTGVNSIEWYPDNLKDNKEAMGYIEKIDNVLK